MNFVPYCVIHDDSKSYISKIDYMFWIMGSYDISNETILVRAKKGLSQYYINRFLWFWKCLYIIVLQVEESIVFLRFVFTSFVSLIL
jgi:hypothetical protein